MGIFTDIWQYMPHGMCLLWKPWLVLLWAGSDALIFTSYFAIPLALLKVLRGRREIPHRGIIVLFALFIMLCGITHLLSIVTMWVPIYPIVGFVKLATGIVSMTTAVVLFKLVPALVNFPSPSDLASVNKNLHEEIEAHEKTLASLREARASLEAKVEARTIELKETNDRLAVLAREAVHRSKNLLSVVSALAQQSAKGTQKTSEFIDTLLGRFQALALATSTVLEGGDKTSEQLEAVVRNQLEPMVLAFGDRVKIKGPSIKVGSEAAQQISLVLHELATNAQKYNFLSSEEAKVVISWTFKSSDEFEFRWDEDLTPDMASALSHEKSDGFGTKLLTRIVPAMLRGAARRYVADDQLSYSLIVPTSSLQSSKDIETEGLLAARLLDDSFGLT